MPIERGMGAPKKADWREERRKRAWKLKEAGWKQNDIAAALGVSEGAVSQRLKGDHSKLFASMWLLALVL